MRILAFFIILILFFYSDALAGAAAPQAKKQRQQMMIKQQKATMQQKMMQQQANRGDSEGPVLSEAELSQTWEMLKSSSQAWRYISDKNSKEYFVAQYISLFHQKGIVIKKTPGFYALMIDDMAKNTPKMLSLPLIKIVQLVTVMEYDFDSGQNKDELALQLLGEEAYQENRKRLGLE